MPIEYELRGTLWLGCVVKTVEERTDDTYDGPYTRLTFKNCQFVCIVTAQDWMTAERLAREYRLLMPGGIYPGDIVNLDVCWRRAPYLGRKRYKSLDNYELNPRLDIHSWLGVPDRIGTRAPLVLMPAGNVSLAKRRMLRIKRWF